MFSWLKYWFTHPLVRGLDIDSSEANAIRSHIIKTKPFLQSVYEGWYSDILETLASVKCEGHVLEIGSGGGFLKKFIPGLITSEVLKIPNMDIFLDGHFLPFKKHSLKAMVMIDVFHHMNHIQSFLQSAAYCIKPGGAMIMVEPWNTPWSRFVYTYLHHEPFDTKILHWDLPEGGPLSHANSAIPWIVFCRDRDKFQREFPVWKIKRINLHTPFRYLVSGGVSMVSLSPKSLYKLWVGIERFFHPWIDSWAMFATICLVRSAEPAR